ncbi:MAG TPA: response regulator, partial [Candidatus Acidoferrales bacterium]|nr:response regulator [Candidatus Acidoferrales bacterium]
LALADLGIEVVSVNNGEAAVRKLGDVSPDLVLADIFMPVRNGYEVCEYVKKDARFSHLPVVLLVGAFDPLDEREAQRVGADGILKKPFVPPDPLITMVKMLLERTLGERLVTVGAQETAVAARGKSGGVATAEAPPAAQNSRSAPAPEAAEEFPEEEPRPPVDRLSFGEGERPMAFESLLGTLTQEPAAAEAGLIEPVADEQILTSSRDASLGDPIFWKTEEPATENVSAEENSEAAPEPVSEPPLRAWKPDEEAVHRSAGDEVLQPVEPFELVREENDSESSQTSTVVETSEIISQDAASQAALTVESAKLEDLAANPLEWMATVPQPPADEVPEALQPIDVAVVAPSEEAVEHEVSLASAAPEETPAESPVAPVFAAVTPEPFEISTHLAAEPAAPPQAPSAAEARDPNKTHPSLIPPAQRSEAIADSVSKQEWADLAARLQSQPAEAPADKPQSASTVASVSTESAAPPPETNSARAAKPVAQSAEDTARAIPKSDWAELTANLQMKRAEPSASAVEPHQAQNHVLPAANTMDGPAAEPPAAEPEPQTLAASAAGHSAPDPMLVEAVVQRILDKMRPQVVEIITKEFLRPIVQALVTREITKR